MEIVTIAADSTNRPSKGYTLRGGLKKDDTGNGDESYGNQSYSNFGADWQAVYSNDFLTVKGWIEQERIT